MLHHAEQIEVDPHRQEHEQRQSAQDVQQPQMVDVRLLQDLLGEDVLQREAHGGQQGGDEADHIEGQLRQGRNANADDDRHQAQVDGLGLPFPEDHPR